MGPGCTRIRVVADLTQQAGEAFAVARIEFRMISLFKAVSHRAFGGARRSIMLWFCAALPLPASRVASSCADQTRLICHPLPRDIQRGPVIDAGANDG